MLRINDADNFLSSSLLVCNNALSKILSVVLNMVPISLLLLVKCNRHSQLHQNGDINLNIYT